MDFNFFNFCFHLIYCQDSRDIYRVYILKRVDIKLAGNEGKYTIGIRDEHIGFNSLVF